MHKKSLFFSLSVLLVLNFTLYAAAQETSSDMNITFLWAHSTVRDSNGYLVAYLENFRIHIVDLVRFNQIIDANIAMAKAEVVNTEIFDEPHEWITITDTATYDQPTVHSTTALGDVAPDGTTKTAVYFLNDGYTFDAGDQLRVTWVISRPIS